MLYIFASILLALWLLAYLLSYTMGGAIHVMFVLAVILLLVRIIFGHRVV